VESPTAAIAAYLNKTMHRSGRSAAFCFRDFFGGHSVMVAVTPSKRMWPFKQKKSIRYESPGLLAFEAALSAVLQLIADLENGEHVADDKIRSIYFTLVKHMQSNCDAVASGLLATIGAICTHARNLVREFLPSAMQPIYYLGIEDFDTWKSYILHVADAKTTYLDTQTMAGQRFLKQLAEDRELLVDAFREMYNHEENNWRDEEPDAPDAPKEPPILSG
jgi:hypothetical protein